MNDLPPVPGLGQDVSPPALPRLPLQGTPHSFTVGRIWCVGRNYRAHALEMGADPDREPPFFFAKPASAVVASDSVLPWPMATGDLHHEVELVVALGRGGARLTPEQALACVVACGVGLDLTRRDLQRTAKAAGQPWEMAKAFDQSAPCSPLRPLGERGVPGRGAIRLEVNGQPRQEGDLAQLIWPVPELLARLSELIALLPGDLIFTGTPAGVGPLRPGDRVEASIEGVGELSIQMAGRPNLAPRTPQTRP